MPILALILIVAASPASAHGGHAVAPAAVWAEWRPDPLLAALLIAAVAAYCRGLVRLWRRAGAGRGVTRLEATAFAAGMLVLALALLSPLETATGTLLSAHMVQHVLLIAVAPPLILLGRPDAVLAFALPSAGAHGLARHAWFRPLAAGLRRLARPLPAAAIHAVAIWVWHAPAPFQAALESRLIHDLEHASFFLTALLFWQAIMAAQRRPALALAAIVATLATLIQGGFLAALITLTPRRLYPAYGGSELWGLAPMEDQQLAGLIMWVPAGAIYLIAGLALAARLIGGEAATGPRQPLGKPSSAPPLTEAR